MNHLMYLLTILFLVIPSFTVKASIVEKAVRESVNYQMKTYPKSTLKDLYKHFFQDRYGPGHMINDSEAAKNYLQKELNSYTIVTGEIAEPTGWQHNFYRVNLSVIKNELIPLDLFFDVFLQSANEVKPVAVEDWKKEWFHIETIIKSMELSLTDFEKDSNEIKERLSEGKYIGHHSAIYNKTYAPHYRIISREIFFEKLLPLLAPEN